MNFYQNCPFNMQFGPVIGYDMLITKMKRLFGTSCIINEVTLKLSDWPEIWPSDRKWQSDYKND